MTEWLPLPHPEPQVVQAQFAPDDDGTDFLCSHSYERGDVLVRGKRKPALVCARCGEVRTLGRPAAAISREKKAGD
jgi:hypothetical protein